MSGQWFLWALLAPISFVLNLVTYALAPFLSALSMLTGPVLPGPLSLFHTHDDDLDGGQHQLEWPKVTGFKLWLQRTKWIMRNPAYGFDAYVFGFEKGDQAYDYHSTTHKDGSIHEHYVIHAKEMDLPCYRAQLMLGKRRYVKIFAGWSPWDNETGYHMLKVDLNPFKKREDDE